MAGKIRVSTRELRNRANELENLNEKFHQEVMKLRQDETNLNSSYEGDAQKKFHEQFTLDVEKFDKFYTMIQQYIVQLRSDADQYDRTENINVDIASRRK